VIDFLCASSRFVNRMFSPVLVDWFFDQMFLSRHAQTDGDLCKLDQPQGRSRGSL
jgi:hypothetical protein